MGKVTAARPARSEWDPKLLPSFECASAGEILSWAHDTFEDRVALVTGFGSEGTVLIDLISRLAPGLRVITVDTGRLPEETYELMERVRSRYSMEIEVFFPDQRSVERLVRDKGLFSFRESVDNRKECCWIRKVEPLRRALSTLDAWVTGLRRGQSVTRQRIAKAAPDDSNEGILKLNPLADWSEEEVWDYIRRNDVPHNKLHHDGFPSIGCAPCTRAVALGEEIRAGRWWWERPEEKECGLHFNSGE